MNKISSIYGYTASPRYPAHMVLQVESTIHDFRRIKKILDRFLPNGYLVITNPEIKVAQIVKEVLTPSRKSGPPTHHPHDGIYHYAIRIWYNDELKKFSIYRHMTFKALIRKLMK